MAASRSRWSSRPPGSRLCCLFFAAFLAGSFFQHQASGQQGFINIDCGAVSGAAYQNPDTGFLYSSDSVYVSTGIPTAVRSTSTVTGDLKTLRYFPASTTPVKNCFDVPVVNATTYLVRALFYFGDYASRPPSGTVQFKMALDASDWADVTLNVTGDFYYWYEAIIRPAKPSVSVCLIRVDGGGDPFISTLELRPLPVTSYVFRYDNPFAQFLYAFKRQNFGSADLIRFPNDAYDRLWESLDAAAGPGLTDLLAPGYPAATIAYNNSFPHDSPPSLVMASAITASPNLLYTISGFVSPATIYVGLLLAELNVSLPGKRVINMELNFFKPANGGQFFVEDLSLVGPPLTVFQDTGNPVSVASGIDTLSFNFSRNSASAGDPIVNALEIYYVKPVSPGTSKQDADALASLKTVLKYGQWSGDPCLPVPWDEVVCTGNRVTSLNLAGKNLSGLIPDDIGQLTALTSLDLSNNSFTGSLPAWVGDLQSLDVLDLSNNQLSGTFPASYITSISGFRYSGNPQLRCVDSGNAVCPAGTTPAPSTPRVLLPPPPPTPTASSKTSIVPIIGGIVGGILVILVIGGLLIWFCRRRGTPVKMEAPPAVEHHSTSTGTGGSPINVSVMRKQAQQPFTLSAIKEATHNYARKLGEGGFGPVYFGILPNKQEVAVKVMSGKTQQGVSEFLNEIELLSTVHFKKLVSLVGYCQEGSDLILLYEYMSGGDLRSRLYGPQAVQNPLNWRQRLQIALDAARGLEYLHHGCQPSIFHRDVKSSNILLSSKLEAKVADFGLSKLTDDGQTHVMTMVKGTLGYLDPEYNSTGMLTEKSDVYSFGVVLLEIMCGQPPIAKDGPQKFIVDRVRTAMNTGALERVVDPALRGDYRLESVWRYAEIAMSCVHISTANRPYMNKLVSELTQAVEIEFGGQQGWTANSDSNSEVALNSNYSGTSYSNITDQPSQIFFSDDQPRPY